MTERKTTTLTRAKLLGSEVYGWIYTLDGPSGRTYKAIRRDASVALFSSLREAEEWLREGRAGDDAGACVS